MDVKVCFEEVMRACGGAVAGVREKVLLSSLPSSSSSFSSSSGKEGRREGGQVSSSYGMHEHNRGEDGFLFLPDGGFQHGPDRLVLGGEGGRKGWRS